MRVSVPTYQRRRLWTLNQRNRPYSICSKFHRNPDGPCQILSSLTAGYGCRCIQKFSYRKLVWITDDNKHGVDDFKVPSCCSCRWDSSSVTHCDCGPRSRCCDPDRYDLLTRFTSASVLWNDSIRVPIWRRYYMEEDYGGLRMSSKHTQKSGGWRSLA